MRTNLGHADEELAPIRPRTSVGHAQDTGSGVLECEVLVIELGPVNRRPPSPVRILKVTTLIPCVRARFEGYGGLGPSTESWGSVVVFFGSEVAN